MYSAWPISMAPLAAQASAVPPSFLIHTFNKQVGSNTWVGYKHITKRNRYIDRKIVIMIGRILLLKRINGHVRLLER